MSKNLYCIILICTSFAALLCCAHTWDKGNNFVITTVISGAILLLYALKRTEGGNHVPVWSKFDFFESLALSAFPAYSILEFRLRPMLGIQSTGICIVLWSVLVTLLALFLLPVIKRINHFLTDNSLHRLNTATNHVYFYRVCLCMACCILLTFIIFSFNGYIWLDEAFTMVFIEPTWPEMMQMLAADVHPPLYYLITKAFVDTGVALFPTVNSIYLAKLAAVIPYYILVFWGVHIIKKYRGYTAAGIFAVAVVGTSPLIEFSTEARMYGWAMLFVTATYLNAYLISRFQRAQHWAGFIICSLSAAYSHYFAVVAVIPAFVYVLFVPAPKLRWLVCCAIVVFAYSPWLPIFFEQVTRVSDNYWIEPIQYGNVLSFMKYPVPIFSAMSAFLLLGYGLKQSVGRMQSAEGKTDGAFFLTCQLTPYFVVATGLLACCLLRPVFIDRYIIPTLGTFWLGLTLSVCNKKSNATSITAILITLCALAQCVMTVLKEHSDYSEHQSLIEFCEDHTEAIYIVQNPYPCFTMSVSTNNKVFHWKAEQNQTFPVTGLRNKDELTKALAETSTIYFISTGPDEQRQFTMETGLKCKAIMKLRIGCSDTTIHEVQL